jgi:hypothetical protein
VDAQELVDALRRDGVPDELYDIPGVHDVPVPVDAYYFLRPASSGWTVGIRERGKDRFPHQFHAEDEACRFLRTRLMELVDSAPPPTDAAERMAEVLAHADEIQREAWRQYERARREQERREKDEEAPPQSS